LDYPQGWEVTSGRINSDGVFYFVEQEFWHGDKFIFVPTEGAEVEGDTLDYPLRNGKLLKLKFTPTTGKEMTHPDAAEHCKDLGLRLPTARELFDFCAVGVEGPNYGPGFRWESYPRTARCYGQFLWSASVNSSGRVSAWQFSGGPGNVYVYDRPNSSGGVRCVGGP
jgi:hypothetical protein